MQRVDMDNKEYIVGIDIGSSNVTMAVGTQNESGEISVLGVEVQKIEGCVKDGDVANYILLGDAIAKAKSALETDLGLRLNSAYVGISGRSVYCVRYEDYININESTGCVTDLEMRELNARIEAVAPSGADDIIDRILLRYCIDDRQEVSNPLGSYGRKLSVTYLYVMAGRNQIERVNKALHRAEIRKCGLCINPTLLPDLLLTPEEKDAGVAIVDIGGDLTDIAVVREGKLCYFSSLPIGSSSIDNDLHNSLNIPKTKLTEVKHKYGAAIASHIAEDAAISIKTAARQNKPILQRNIAEIIEERLKDIAHFVLRELKAAKFSTRIPCGVVLTGGATYLSNIEDLFARELNMEVRVGDMLNGLNDDSQAMVCAKPQAIAIGLLLYGAKNKACDTFSAPVTNVVPPILGQNQENNTTTIPGEGAPIEDNTTQGVNKPEDKPEDKPKEGPKEGPEGGPEGGTKGGPKEGPKEAPEEKPKYSWLIEKIKNGIEDLFKPTDDEYV